MITKPERSWIFWFAIVFMLITTLPYFLGYFFQGDDWRYTGLLIAAEDGNSYVAKMLLGANGDWLFRTPYTPFEQSGFLAFFPYILLGKLAASPSIHEQLIALFHIFRMAGGMLYFYGTYAFIANFTGDIGLRRWGTVFAAAGGGLGWLSVLGLSNLWGDRLALEFYSPETFGFLSLLALPHLAAGRGLLLLGLSTYLKAQTDERPFQAGLKSGLWWLALGFMQPLTVVVAWTVAGSHLFGGMMLCGMKKLDWKHWRQYLLKAVGMGLTSMPIVAYTMFSFRIDPFLKGWEKQNLIPSPPITDYLLAYGPILVLAAVGVWRYFQRIHWSGLLLVTWTCIFPILAYIPYNLQRRLPEGIWTAFICLAISGLSFVGNKKHKTSFAWLSVGFVSSGLLLLGGVMGVLTPNSPLFLPAGQVRLFNALSDIAPKGAIVLASYDTSNAVPAWAPVRTLIGHGPESIRLQEIRPRVETAFLSESDDATREALIDEFHVDYVLFGPTEQKTSSWEPSQSNYLTQVYRDGDYKIYRVVR